MKRLPGASAVVSCLLAATLAGSPVPAQQLAGQVIREIELLGNRTLTQETLEYYLGLSVGGTFRPQQLNSKIHEIWSTQLIDDISVETRQVEGGVRVVVKVEERPTLRSIEYQGLKRISRADISDRVAQERIEAREGDPLGMGELYRLKAAIEDLYEEKGFRLAEARFTIDSVSVSDRRILFTIDEGDKVQVGEIDFEGNTVFRDGRLRRAVEGKKPILGPILGLFKKNVFKDAVFAENLDKVRELYRKGGYKNVVLGDPKIEVRAINPDAPAEKQKRRLFITVPVEEGSRWKLGEITIEGNERFPDEVLLRQFQRPSGGWLRSTVIDEGIETIGEIYSNTGHLFAQVKPELVERDEQVADLIVHVDEGDQFRVGRIEFEGNTKTRDKVIRREMGIQEGLVLNSGALRNSLLRIRQLEFFKIDEEDPVAFDIEEEEQTVNLMIKGEEGDRTELLFGGGFSEIDGFFGQFQFKTRNFLGRGETLGISVLSGARQDVYDLSYFVPWFLDKPQSVGIQIFQRRLDFALLTGQRNFQDTRGGTLTYGRNLGLFRNFSVSYTFFDSEDQRTLFDFEGSLVEQEFSRSLSSIRLGLVRDRRDSRLQPTVGSRYSLSVDYTGGILGGTTNFVRPRAAYTIYKPLTKGTIGTVFAFNVEAAAIEPFDDVELFPNDRLYLGGENSIRGFRFRSIWVRDEEGKTVLDEFGFPLGGERSFQTNLEYHLLLGGPFRLVAFADGGKVFTGAESLNLDNFRTSAGIELQVNVPILGAPLRFIYSRNLDPLPSDRFETFQFSIGSSF